MKTLKGPTDHVVVVGAGLSGLSAALHLLGAGRRVTVVERDGLPGGRAGLLERGGYRMDTGPTVLTMPDLIDEAFAAVGESLAGNVELVGLHPAYRAEFADGGSLDVHTGAEAMEAEINRFAGPREAAGYRRLRQWLEDLYTAQRSRFIDANFDSPLQLLHPDLARLAGLRGFGRLDAQIGRFLSDERLRRVFSFQALYAGVPPARALAAYAVIAYMDTVAGVYFPRGGMHALPRAMAAAAERAGAEFRWNSEATRLERSLGRVTAVHTARGERVPCDAVVLTPDLPVVYRLLGHAPRRPLALRHSPSAVVLHAGTDRTWDRLAHHTISFGAAWKSTFRELTRDGRPMSDPSLLITRPTTHDPSLAPPGHHLHYILAPCPNTDIGPGAHEWRDLGPRYRDRLLAELERRGLDGIGAAIEEECLVTPADWAAQGHAAGTPFSAAHTFAQTGPFRPRNLVRGVDNAVLAGCGTTPGVGVPTVLISGKLAAARVTGPAGGAGASARKRITRTRTTRTRTIRTRATRTTPARAAQSQADQSQADQFPADESPAGGPGTAGSPTAGSPTASPSTIANPGNAHPESLRGPVS
ncbi:phytoene desaturase [Streptomyces sp. GC420]|uniref:phytoene desaturase n=1 Tax=Streptomyces sp. GC420 TaxID=2697568 RepID=UPI0014151D09|nr:phytoene desaturase [Streptomyces sp. GC420]NBM17661.1 phytoene desaturase [Streptomyces sp. GC420]